MSRVISSDPADLPDLKTLAIYFHVSFFSDFILNTHEVIDYLLLTSCTDGITRFFQA